MSGRLCSPCRSWPVSRDRFFERVYRKRATRIDVVDRPVAKPCAINLGSNSPCRGSHPTPMIPWMLSCASGAMGMQVLLERRRRVAEQLSARRIRLSDLRARRSDCHAEESSNQLLAAIEQEAEVCRQLAGKFLQLEATILAGQRRPKTPRKTTKTKVGTSRKWKVRLKSNRLSVRLALLDGK